MAIPLRVLIVEDSENDTLLLARELQRGGYDLTYERVDSLEAMKAGLDKQWDIVLSDYSMPDFRGTDALLLLREKYPDIPFIYVSGTLGEDMAVGAMKAGANDYVMKGNLRRLIPAIRRELQEAETRRERRRLQEERDRLFEETQRNLERIRALHDIDLAITSSLDLATVLGVLLEKIQLFLPFPHISVVRLVNKDTGKLDPVAWRAMEKEIWQQVPSGIFEQVYQDRTPRKIQNIQADPQVDNREFFRLHGLVSYAGVPLVVKEESLGVLSLYTREEHEFADEEIEFLNTLAGQAAIAIQNSLLYEEIKSSRSELESTNRRLEKSLREVSSFYSALAPLAPADSLNHLMEGIIARLMIATGADAALIRLWDDAKGALTLASQRGFPDYYLKAVEAADPGGAAYWVFKSGEPIISPNIAAEARFKGKNQLKVGLRSCAMLPLKVENRVRGIVHLASRDLGFFDESQRDHLVTIARQMSIMLENREFFQHLKTSRDELEKSNKVKDEFLSVMSHELRTPLNVVVGYTGMIMDGLLGEVNDKQKEAMEKVINRTNDQLAMVNNILYATIVETEKIKVESHPVVLGDFFKQLSSTYEIPLNKQLAFNWDCPSPLAVIHTDSAKLKQILQNLIDNALKFTSKGSITVSAQIRQQAIGNRQQEEQLLTPLASRLSPTWVEFKVSDTGVGIPKDHLPFVFDKFRQVDSSETRLFGGVGMGLYIVKKFTELLGGKVEVESEPGKGTTFTVTIPSKS